MNMSWFLVVKQNEIFNHFCKKWSLHGIAYLPWTLSHVAEISFASLISWGHFLVPCKSKLHRPSSKLCHFITLEFEPHHLPSEWCHFTSYFWSLDDVIFLQDKDRLLVLHHFASIGMFVQCWVVDDISLHLQSLDGDSLHLQSLNKDSLHFQDLVGISLHLQSLDGDSLHLQRLEIPMFSSSANVDMASWQRWTLAQLRCEVLSWLHDKDGRWCSFGVSEVLA